MTEEQKQSWHFGKRDLLFLGIVAAVVLTLVLGAKDKTTKAVPDDDVHRNAVSRAECMACHNATGVHPQPKRHVKGGQCFQCHTQPEGWRGGRS